MTKEIMEEQEAFEAKFGAKEYVSVEDFAKNLHESDGVSRNFKEQSHKFIEWDDLSEPRKDCRRVQALYLMQKQYIVKSNG